MKYSLSECVDIISGGTPKKSESKYWLSGTIPWVTVKDFKDKYITSTEQYITKSGLKNSAVNLTKDKDVLISARGTVGKLSLVNAGYTFNQSIYGLRAHTNILNPEYLYYWLTCNIQQIRQNTHGSVFNTITKETFNHIFIDLPSIEEQKTIIDKVNPFDNKIEINNQINNNLFKLAKIHFDRQLDSENIKFSQISTIQNGYAFKSKEYVDTNELMILRTKNINDNHLFSKNDVVYISKELFDEYKKFSFSAFDTVLVMVGASIGKTGFVTSNMTPSLQNQNMWRFRPKMSNIPGLLIFQYVNYINKHIIGSATGSARSFYRKKLFSEFEVPRINSTNYIYFDTLQREIDHLNTENEILYRIKHSLLNHYF